MTCVRPECQTTAGCRCATWRLPATIVILPVMARPRLRQAEAECPSCAQRRAARACSYGQVACDCLDVAPGCGQCGGTGILVYREVPFE